MLLRRRTLRNETTKWWHILPFLLLPCGRAPIIGVVRVSVHPINQPTSEQAPYVTIFITDTLWWICYVITVRSGGFYGLYHSCALPERQIRKFRMDLFFARVEWCDWHTTRWYYNRETLRLATNQRKVSTQHTMITEFRSAVWASPGGHALAL